MVKFIILAGGRLRIKNKNEDTIERIFKGLNVLLQIYYCEKPNENI